jgi:hypothetical protein
VSGLTVHLDASVRLWDVRTAQMAHEISRVHKQPITSVSLVPNKEHGMRPVSPCRLTLHSWCCWARSIQLVGSLCQHLDSAAAATSGAVAALCATVERGREWGGGGEGVER